MCYDFPMHLRAPLAAAIAAFALLLPFAPTFGIQTAHAHTFVEMSVDYLAKASSRVIVGVPVDEMSVWEPTDGGQRIVTYHRVQVQSNVVGEGPQEVWVRRLGGVVEGVGQVVHGAATLRTHQPVLLFLVARTDGTLSVVGMEQGCFPVHVSKDRKATIERRRISHAPVPAGPGPKPSSSLEGLSFEEAKRIILEARSRNAR
ncbi:MAG: hypothetical protein CVU63_16685 [Deltaproteobacteria bacterium HGW-Deltaproteobacteria-20]|nr:MAG: hypothetical protein CVU63_16685 [Deltaproteobacteria bacterium HGW-Deltaproteobacteria-20]